MFLSTCLIVAVLQACLQYAMGINMRREECQLHKFFKPAPLKGGFSMEDYWVWCGSVIKGEDGNYHMFASRWKKTYQFHPGWGIDSEVVRAVSGTPEGPYIFEEVVLPPRAAGYWDGRITHNPVIQKHGDTYVLFYMGSTYPYPDMPQDGSLNFESYQWICSRSNKRIGMATSKSIFGPWKRSDRPLLDVRLGHFDDFFTSNPAPCINPDGSCLLVYKTRSWKKPPYGEYKSGNEMYSGMKLGAAWAPHWSGPYERLTEKPLFEDGGEVEDPFIWRTDTGYAMIAKDFNGIYTGNIGDGVYATSEDGVKWNVRSEPSFTRDILWDDGKVRKMGNMDRPFLLIDENGEATHLFVATNDGTDVDFITMNRAWNACIPLA